MSEFLAEMQGFIRYVKTFMQVSSLAREATVFVIPAHKSNIIVFLNTSSCEYFDVLNCSENSFLFTYTVKLFRKCVAFDICLKIRGFIHQTVKSAVCLLKKILL